jgi:hypothetical protein
VTPRDHHQRLDGIPTLGETIGGVLSHALYRSAAVRLCEWSAAGFRAAIDPVDGEIVMPAGFAAAFPDGPYLVAMLAPYMARLIADKGIDEDTRRAIAKASKPTPYQQAESKAAAAAASPDRQPLVGTVNEVEQLQSLIRRRDREIHELRHRLRELERLSQDQRREIDRHASRKAA